MKDQWGKDSLGAEQAASIPQTHLEVSCGPTLYLSCSLLKWGGIERLYTRQIPCVVCLRGPWSHMDNCQPKGKLKLHLTGP